MTASATVAATPALVALERRDSRRAEPSPGGPEGVCPPPAAPHGGGGGVHWCSPLAEDPEGDDPVAQGGPTRIHSGASGVGVVSEAGVGVVPAGGVKNGDSSFGIMALLQCAMVGSYT